MKSIAITGSSGFIGTRLSVYLLSKGFRVIGLRRLDSVVLPPNPHIETRFVDYTDVNSILSALQGVHIVVHLASLVHRSDLLHSYSSYHYYGTSIVTATANLASAASRLSIDRFIYISSISVNSIPDAGKIISSCDNECPLNNYAIAKLSAEQILKSISSLSSFSYIILRPPLVYGSNAPGAFSLLKNVFRLCPVNIFSTLSAQRSFISIENLVEVIFLCCTVPAVLNESYVIADPVPVSVSLLAEIYYSLDFRRTLAIPIPPLFYKAILYMFAKSAVWSKITTSLVIDSTTFSQHSGWVPSSLHVPPDSLFRALSD